MELTEYKCHKTVQAGKIASFDLDEYGEHCLVLVGHIEPIIVSEEYMHKHVPQVGGYYLMDEDGYESFLPAEAFEAGYTKIN